jgi:hypothetical protein
MREKPSSGQRFWWRKIFSAVLGGFEKLATIYADEILNMNFVKCAGAARRLLSSGNMLPVRGHEIPC